MHRNPTAPAPQSVQTAPIMLSIAAVKLDLASWRHRKPIDEATAVSLGDARWLASKPAEGMVDCPRCQGNGYVDFDRRRGPLRKLCPVCGGSCVVDASTAETVRRLIEADDLGTAEFPPASDVEDDATTAGPDACCSDDEKTPCLPCSVAHEYPGEMDDRFAGEHAAALAGLLAVSAVAHADPSELRDDELPGAYPVFYPTPDDEAWEADHPTFLATLARAGDLFRTSANGHLRYIAGVIDQMYDDAVRTGAQDGETLEDRLEAERAVLGPDARRVPWATVAASMRW